MAGNNKKNNYIAKKHNNSYKQALAAVFNSIDFQGVDKYNTHLSAEQDILKNIDDWDQARIIARKWTDTHDAICYLIVWYNAFGKRVENWKTFHANTTHLKKLVDRFLVDWSTHLHKMCVKAGSSYTNVYKEAIEMRYFKPFFKTNNKHNALGPKKRPLANNNDNNNNNNNSGEAIVIDENDGEVVANSKSIKRQRQLILNGEDDEELVALESAHNNHASSPSATTLQSNNNSDEHQQQQAVKEYNNLSAKSTGAIPEEQHQQEQQEEIEQSKKEETKNEQEQLVLQPKPATTTVNANFVTLEENGMVVSVYEEEYEIEKIMGHKKHKTFKYLFYIKWLGYPKKKDWTWEPPAHLEAVKDTLVKEYCTTNNCLSVFDEAFG